MVRSEVSPRVLTPRERRRVQTEQEILDAALEVMAEEGVAGLNLTRVAARVGLRQPSLYQYFASRDAVYDALFERGMQGHLAAVTAAMFDTPSPGWAAVRALAHATLSFSARHPVLGQLLFMPAVPGFHPSERAYAPSVEVQDRLIGAFATAVDRNELHPTAATERGIRLFVGIVAGIGGERASNQPNLQTEDDLHNLLDPALDMYSTYFDPLHPASWTPWPTPPPTIPH